MQQHCYFGGTFNPVHIGHARLALECQASMNAPFHFVPCANPPLKAQPQVSAEQRLAMLELLVNELNAFEEPRFDIEPWELNQEGRSYTVRTLKYLRETYPTRPLAWVIGMDSFAELHRWHQWQELCDLANLVVFNRPGHKKPIIKPF